VRVMLSASLILFYVRLDGRLRQAASPDPAFTSIDADTGAGADTHT